MTGGTVDALGPVPLPRMEVARLAGGLHAELERAERALRSGDYLHALDLLRAAGKHPLFGHVAVDPREMREYLDAPRQTTGDTGGIPEPPDVE